MLLFLTFELETVRRWRGVAPPSHLLMYHDDINKITNIYYRTLESTSLNDPPYMLVQKPGTMQAS